MIVRHSPAQETPVPIYVGLQLHAHTHKRELIDNLCHVGMSISYDCVLWLSTDTGNTICKMCELEKVVCPPTIRGNLFTTSAVDNIDHDPSSTTAKHTFHGTSISLLQHKTSQDDRVVRNLISIERLSTSKSVHNLPHYYTDVAPVSTGVKGSPLPAGASVSLQRYDYESHKEEEDRWLRNVHEILLDTEIEEPKNIFWAAHHAHRYQKKDIIVSLSALLPLFHENAHSIAMIRHSMDIIRNAVDHINNGQVPVITFDQPLYTIAKQIQWKWSEIYGEEKFVIMLHGLHIEKAALSTVGDWLKGSGSTSALVQATVTTRGTADSFLKVSHITRTRHAHQITLTSLFILKKRAYENYHLTLEENKVAVSFEIWCEERASRSPHF